MSMNFSLPVMHEAAEYFEAIVIFHSVLFVSLHLIGFQTVFCGSKLTAFHLLMPNLLLALMMGQSGPLTSFGAQKNSYLEVHSH